MTLKQKQDILEQYIAIGQMVRELERERAMWDSGAPPDTDKKRLIADIDKQMHKLRKAREDISRAVFALPDKRLSLILQMRYLCGDSWSDISQALHYDTRWIMRLKKRALQQINLDDVRI